MKHNEQRTRIDCESEANHNLIRLLDKPGMLSVVAKWGGFLLLDNKLNLWYLANIFFEVFLL